MPARTFTYDEALALFPRVRSLTAAAVRRVETLSSAVRSREEGEERRTELEETFQVIVTEWARRVRSLGAEVKGLWLVDFDSGDGYYCWRWPEEVLGHFHDSEQGFADRLPVQ